MLSTMNLNQIWSEIIPQQGTNVGRRVDPDHKLDFFIGYDDECFMQLMLLSQFIPDLPSSSQQINIRANQRTDGLHAICFVLTNQRLKDMFILLCWDLMDSSYLTSDTKAGILSVIKRFRMWQILLAEANNRKMSVSLIHGLLGELWVLKNVCMKQYNAEKAVAGWVGPIQSDRDFEYEDTWYEIKTTSLSKDAVSISSHDQLDVDQQGYLLICRIEKAASTNQQSFSLIELVDEVENQLNEFQYALSIFRTRLVLYGYDSNDESANDSYVLHRCEKYFVSEDFPRIRRSLLPAAISNGEYYLNIASLQRWRVE